MPTSSDFSEYYKTLPAEALLGILANPDDYQPAAIEAAKKELADRRLSADELDAATRLAAEESALKEQQKQKKKNFEVGLKSKGHALFEALNPVQQGVSGPEKIIRIVVIVFGLLFVLNLLMSGGDYLDMLRDMGQNPEYTFLLIPVLLFLPAGLVGFWKKRQTGWVLLAVFLTTSFVSALLGLIQALIWKPSGYSLLDQYLGPPPVMEYVLILVVYGAGIYAICRKDVRQLCRVNESRMSATLIITAVLSFFVLFSGGDLFR